MTKAELIKELEEIPEDFEIFVFNRFAGDRVCLRVVGIETNLVSWTDKKNISVIGEKVIGLLIST